MNLVKEYPPRSNNRVLRRFDQNNPGVIGWPPEDSQFRSFRSPEMVIISQLVIRLVQVEIIHHILGVCLLGFNHFRKERIFP